MGWKNYYRSVTRSGLTTPTPASDNSSSPFNGISKGSVNDFDVKKDGKLAVITRKDDKSFSIVMNQTSEGHWKIVQLDIPELMKK